MSESEHEHLSLFKSKSGHHLSRLDPRERMLEERKQNRINDRHAAFTSRRVIDPTPRKLPNLLTQPQSSAIPSRTKNVISTATTSNTTNNLSRQQEFHRRFLQYRTMKREKLKTKTGSAPFLSTVPTGRFISPKAIGNPSATKKVCKQPTKKIIGQLNVPKFSPINTRSKNIQPLLSPSQLPTPKRKKRKSAVLREAVVTVPRASTSAASKTAKVTFPKRIISTKVKPTLGNSALIKKETNIATASNKKVASVPAAKTVVGTINKAPIAAFKLAIPPKIPKRFEFQPAELNSIATSTLMKPRKSSIAKPANNSKQLFNESVSPIESVTPKKIQLVSSKKPLIKDVLKAAAGAAAALPTIQNEDILNTTPVNTENPLNESTNYVSPFVTISRGAKQSLRKELEARNAKYTLPSRKSLNLNSSIEERQNTEAAQYFRLQIKRETDRLSGLIDKWLAIKTAISNQDIDTYEAKDVIPSEYIDLIDVVVGQTRLLISSKFEQFRVLVDKCEASVAIHPVRPEDLEGFWGVVYIQIENCNKRFDRLEVLKENQWQDPDLKVTKKKKIRSNNAISKNIKPKAFKANIVLAEMLKAARKNFIDNQQKEQNNECTGNEKIFAFTRRKSLLAAAQLNDSISRRSRTPRKSIWIVSKYTSINYLQFI